MCVPIEHVSGRTNRHYPRFLLVGYVKVFGSLLWELTKRGNSNDLGQPQRRYDLEIPYSSRKNELGGNVPPSSLVLLHFFYRCRDFMNNF